MKKWLVLLILLVGSHANAVLPAGVSLSGGKHCNSFKQAVSVSSGTVTCLMSNVNSGDTVIIGYNLAAATTYSVTATESPTCPAGLIATRNVGGFIHDNGICYIVLSSSHASFQITVTITAGGGARQGMIDVWEFAGLGAIDTGSEAAVNAVTTSFTTAANNEFAFGFVADQNTPLSPGGSNNQWNQIAGTNTAGNDYRAMDITQVTGTAGSYTASFSPSCAVNNVCFVSVVAFAVSGGSPQAAVYPNQQAQYIFADGTGVVQLNLNNTLAGSKIVIGYYLEDNAPMICDTLATGETCTCPANASAHHLYSGVNYTVGLCYIDLTSAHSGLIIPTVHANGGGLQSPFWVGAYEMVGLKSGIDAPSEAAAAAITVSYTTAQANEWTFGAAGDGAATYPPNLMTPGNSFSPEVNSFTDVQSSVYVEGLAADKITAASGSNTWSYSMTSATFSLLATASFIPSPPATGFPMVF